MKKLSFIVAASALIISSLACQTLKGGGSAPVSGEPSYGQPTSTTAPENGDNSSGADTSGGNPQFLMPSGAQNVVTAGGTQNFQVKMSLDDGMQFYRTEFGKLGYTERKALTVTSSTTFSMVFDGHKSGKAIVVQGVDLGNGTINISIRLEDV